MILADDSAMSWDRRRDDGNWSFPPHLLSDEEIEMYLKGDRREVDRLILFSINRLTAVILPHAVREDARDAASNRLLADLGGEDALMRRADFVDSLIENQEAKKRMMEKVSSSTVVWALLVFLGFVAAAVWEHISTVLKAKIGG